MGIARASRVSGRGTAPGLPKIRTPLLMDAFAQGGIFRGKQVSVIDLPEEARDVVGDELPLTFGTGRIEALIRQAEDRGESIQLGPPAAAELALMMTHAIGRYQVERVYWSAGTGVLCGVIEAIRTTLTELVAEIRAGTAAGDDTPSPETVGQAVQFVVYGKGNRITVATAGPGGTATAKSGNEEPEETRFWTWRRGGAVIVGLATIAGAVAAILALHPFLCSPDPHLKRSGGHFWSPLLTKRRGKVVRFNGSFSADLSAAISARAYRARAAYPGV